MSVNIEHYIIKGVKLDKKLYKAYFKGEDELEESLCFNDKPEGKLGILYDGMNVNYILAGKCSFYTEEYYGIPLIKIEKTLEEEQEEINNWLKSNNLDWMSEDYQIETYIVSHAY